MKDTQKFTLTVGQLRELVKEATGEEIDEAGFLDTVKGWFGGKKQPAAQAAPAAAPAGVEPAPAAVAPADAQAGQPAQDPAKEQGIVKKLLGDFLQKLTAVKDPFKLRKVLTAIIDSDDALEAIQNIQQIKKEADAEDAAKQKEQAAQGGQDGGEQAEAPAEAQPTNEDETDVLGWINDPDDEELAKELFDHYEEYAGIPKSVVYDYVLNGKNEDEMGRGFENLVDVLNRWGISKNRHLNIFACIDKMFIDNKPEEIDEGLWDRARSKAAGWMNTAKAAANNVNSWLNSDDDGNSPIAKQSIRGAGQTAKFSTLINQYIKKIEWLKNAVIKANEFYRKDSERGKAAADMVAKMDAFIQQAQAALKQTNDELKANGYDRKAQGAEKKDGEEKPEDGEKKSDDKPTGDEKPEDGKSDGDEKKVDENTKIRLTLAQLRQLVSEAVDDVHFYEVWYGTGFESEYGEAQDEFEFSDRKDAFKQIAMDVSETGVYPTEIKEDGESILEDFDKWCETDAVNEGFGNFLKKLGKGAVDVGKSIAQNVATGAKNAYQTAKGAAKELGDKKTWSRSTWTLDDYAQKLARIVAELEMDLKEMSWSPKQNPGLAKVIKDLEVSANEIHKKGEQGQASNLDKVRYQAGKMAGAMAMGAVQGVILGTLLKPLRSFMSPRWYAALVAAATVLLRALMKNMEKMDLKDDDKEEKAAAEAALAKGEAMNPPDAGGATPPPLPNAGGQPAAEPTAGGAPAEPAAAPASPAAPAAPAPAAPAPAAPSAAPTPAQPAAADAEFAKRSAAAKKGAQTRAANKAAAQALHQKRSDAAKRGAQTKAANAQAAADALRAKRSAAAKKGAQTRAANRAAASRRRRVRESQKFTLTVGQLRKLIKEARNG